MTDQTLAEKVKRLEVVQRLDLALARPALTWGKSKGEEVYSVGTLESVGT